jgi:hypothetical protein
VCNRHLSHYQCVLCAALTRLGARKASTYFISSCFVFHWHSDVKVILFCLFLKVKLQVTPLVLGKCVCVCVCACVCVRARAKAASYRL